MILSELEFKPVFYTGSGDPEMDRIEDILAEHGHDFVRATYNGERVRPDTAYRANNVHFPDRGAVFVECSVDGVSPVKIIDHHREGDPGYDLPPERYWAAASIGQLVTFLELEPIYEDRVMAAMDHCSAAALRGECPGVNPGDVFDLRISKIMESKNITRSEALGLLKDSTDKIEEAEEIVIGDGTVKDLRGVDLGLGYSLENLIMSLAYATTREPLLLAETSPGCDARRKVTIHSSDVDQIDAFMQVWAPENGFVDIYGVASREYAGAYYEVLV